MRVISEALQNHLSRLETTYAFFLLITPVGGPAEGYTSHDLSHEIDGVTYDAESAQAPARVPTRLKLNTDAAESVFLGGGAFDFQLLKLGYYEKAKFRLFAANYEGDLTDQVTLMAGTLGQAEIEDDTRATIQFNSLAAPANKPSGRHTSPLCDCPRFGRGACENSSAIGGDNSGPSIATYTTTGTVTAAVSAQRFTLDVADVALIGWADARFLGIVRATGGANYNEPVSYGKEEVVKSFNSGTGEVVLRVPLPFVPEVGDTFDCERGCDFAWETCKEQPGSDGSNGNCRNFMGFPFVPIDKVQKRQS